MLKKNKKEKLDIGYLRTATSSSLASGIFASRVHEEEQRLVHEKQPQQIEIELLHNNPYQPRTAMDEESLQQLADVISSQGFQGVLVARPHPQQAGAYQITAGHRRRDAAKRAGFTTLPTVVHPWSDQDMAVLAATENIQREDLTPLEEGKLFQLMIDELGFTQVEVANAVKKDRGYVRNRLRLAKAPSDIQAFVAEKTDSMRAVIYLLDIEDPAERAPIIEQLLKRTLLTEDLPGYIAELKQRKSAASTVPVAPQQPAPQPQATPTTFIAAPQQEYVTREKPSSPTFSPPIAEPPSHVSTSPAPPPVSKPARVTKIKLKTILRYLQDYQQAVAERDTLPEDERDMLRQIAEMTQSLLTGL